jgi:hypothetical protein
MKLQNSILRLFKIPLFTLSMSLLGTSSAQAINFYSLQWTGLSNFSMTGLISGTDLDGNGILQTSNLSSNNEFLSFDVTFKDDLSATLATYNLSALQGFSPTFNFNLQCADILCTTTVSVLQSGNAQTATGFSIGSNSDYVLDTTSGSGIKLSDFTFNTFGDSGGTLTATAVPFEFDASAGILTLGAIWGVNQWRKK